MALERYKKQIFRCFRCSYCRDMISNYSIGGILKPLEIDGVCPVYEEKRFDYYTSRGRIQTARAILSGKLDYTPALIDVVYMCLSCRACTEVCKANPEKPFQGIDTDKVMKAMKEDLASMGMGPLKPLKDRDDLIAERNNPFGHPRADRGKWAKDLNLPDKGELVYYPGCFASYEATETAQATVKTLTASGIEVAYLGADRERCCGHLLIWDGQGRIAEDWAAQNVDSMVKAGAKRVVLSCAGCYSAFKVDYPQLLGKLPFEVLHISELYQELLDQGKLKWEREVQKRITYHDPCHVGRHPGVFDPPRRVVSSIPGVEFVETLRKGKHSLCCGAGAGVVLTGFPDLSLGISKRRSKELKDAADTAVIGGCPACVQNLSLGAKTQRLEMEFYDLPILVAEAMGYPEFYDTHRIRYESPRARKR